MDITKKVTKITYNGINLPIGGNVEYLMIKPMTEIPESTFEDLELTSVIIPNSVTSIGDYAFAINQLTSVTIPDSVTSIGIYVFAENQLTSVVWETAVHIPLETFSGSNNKITSFTITSDSLISIDHPFVFSGVTVENPMTVYVQPQLIEDYKVATNWSVLYNEGRCDFVDIALKPTE